MKAELKQMSLIELKKHLFDSRKKYLSLRIRKNSNEIEDLSLMKKARREVARILTYINNAKRG